MNKNIDIKNIQVAKRYAKALSISAKDCILETREDLNLINDTVFKNDEFKTFFMHPVITLSDKKEAIESAFKNKINKISYNFVETLLDENRFNIFGTICELFKKEVDKIQNRQQVEIISAIEMNDETKERLQNKLNEKLNKNVELNYNIDSNIMGGLIIKIEDRVVDLSLKTKFETLKNII